MKDIAPILKSLGLLESEIKVYLKTLEKGPSTVIELSQGTNLSRQACYVAIEGLTERGLMSSVLKGKRNYYAAEHPAKLVSYAKRREVQINDQIKDLERSIPQLELQIGGERPMVKLFEGKEGLNALINDMDVTQPKEIREIADLIALRSIVQPEDLLEYQKKVKKSQPDIRGFYSGERASNTVQLNTRRITLPAKNAGFNSDVFIYNNKIALITFENKMFSVLIESKALADALKIIFDIAWENQKKQ